MAQTEFGHSVQPQATGKGTAQQLGELVPGLSRLLQLQIQGEYQTAPPYWSRSRDDWLADFVKKPGNDLLAGAVSTVTAKVVANSWYVEGPLLLAGLARDMLLYWSNFGRGWSSMISPYVEAFLSRDAGGILELHRTNASDIEGPAMGYSHLDESKCSPTGNNEYPWNYFRAAVADGSGPSMGSAADPGIVPMHRSWTASIVDMPEGRDRYKGVGFCSVSRALTIALTLQDVARYKRERLSDLPPAGLLLINNLGEEEWADLTAKYDARMYNSNNTVWRNLMTAFGVDPAYPLQAELLSFSELPEHFDEKDFTEITVYSFALAFREDPREFWPVSSGPLGTATEAEIQARSARLKGEGIIANAIERQLNRSDALPDEVNFHFDYQDDQADMLAAELKDLKSQTIRRFWEPSPGSARFGDRGGMPEISEDDGLYGTVQEFEPPPEPQGIITTEEARAWAARERIIPFDILNEPVEIDRIYDTKAWANWRDFGPRVRYYRDGRCFALDRSGGVRCRG